MPTLTTVPLLLLVAFLWYRTKGHVLSIILFTSVFDAAAALNFGAIGISPWLFSLVLCLGIKGLQGYPPFRFTPGLNKTALWLVLLFFVYSCWCGMVYPSLFRGVPVTRTASAVPLEWGMTNLSQICYLVADAVIFFITVSSTREEMEIAVDWFVRGCIVAALIAVWQLANATVHVPYPEDLFYSNKSHVVYRAYKISGLFRLNGPFNEASEMAGFLTVGLGLIGWKLFTQPLRWSTGLSFLLLLSMILMTFSSTGYLVITFMLLCGGYLYIRHLRRQGGISPAKLLIALTLLLGATSMGASHAVRDTLTKVIHTTLLDKDKSASYRQRNESHTAALTTLSATYYMGAGWGSIRASGFAFFLLGSVGILGTALFCGYYISLFVPLFRKRPRSLKPRGDLYERSLFGATILMLGMAVAGSEPTVPIMWALFAVATAGPALVRVSAATPDLIPFAAHRLRPGTAAFSNELLTR